MHWRMLRLKRKQPCLHERRASSPQCLHGCRNMSQIILHAPFVSCFTRCASRHRCCPPYPPQNQCWCDSVLGFAKLIPRNRPFHLSPLRHQFNIDSGGVGGYMLNQTSHSLKYLRNKFRQQYQHQHWMMGSGVGMWGHYEFSFLLRAHYNNVGVQVESPVSPAMGA